MRKPRIKPDSVLSRCFQCLVRRFVPEKALYYELLWAVESVHDGETRHETALRYITEKENSGDFTTANDQAEASPDEL